MATREGTQTILKSYWSILKTFLIPPAPLTQCIPPLLHQNKFIIDFKEKVEMFNNFFTDHCSVLRNKSELPATLKKQTKTRESLTTIGVSVDDILKISQNLDPNKAHPDMISIRMTKICDDSICKPLKLIFQSCLESSEKFQSEWKKVNVVPVHKKADKQMSKNTDQCHDLERGLHDIMFEFFLNISKTCDDVWFNCLI